MNQVKDKTKYPFVMVPNDVIDEETAFSDATEKMIYLVLKRHANLEGEQAYPSMATIAKKALCSESTAKRKVKELIRKGIITKENRYLEMGGKTSNMYTITDFKRWVTVNHAKIKLNHGDGSERPIPQVTVNHKEDTSIKTPIKKNIVEKNSTVYVQVIEHLNSRTGKDFKSNSKATQGMINARLDEGYKVEDFIRVIDLKCDEWLMKKDMVKYLRPSTLFAPSKFEGYVNELPTVKEEVFVSSVDESELERRREEKRKGRGLI